MPRWIEDHLEIPAMPHSPAVAELEGRIDEPGAIDEFLERHDFPLAEPPLYTFVYRGSADLVRLRHWVQALPSSQPFRRLGSSDLWVHTLELPDDSRVEYKIEVVRDGHVEWIADPLNSARAHDPFGANSVVAARGYVEPDWIHEDETIPTGELDEITIESRALGSERRVLVYRPARFRDSRRYPLLVVHDGPDYVDYASLRTVLDQLVHRLEIPGLIVALSEPGDRMREYSGEPDHARFVVEELVPRLEETYPLIDGARARGLMGASLGAVAAFHTALSHPGCFGRLLLQSGSFAFTDIGDHDGGEMLDRIVGMMNAYRREPSLVAPKAFVSVGVYEPLVSENRALVPVLRRAGVEVRFVEARDGHNWENWRDRLREGLSWLFPGPLWMFYE
ncbi:MAG: alpha/beta hydrolase-fold protein [Gemmatimonadota bacterium]|nr:alpha/beta hydrolase-fold protein [Gemmatimonadota bacterium]